MFEAYGLFLDWDPDKARANLAKHRVRFEEAATVFGDPQALYGDDEEHSTPEERRQVVIGTSDRQRVLTVTFTERETMVQINGRKQTVVIRIITAARATRRERHDYEEK